MRYTVHAGIAAFGLAFLLFALEVGEVPISDLLLWIIGVLGVLLLLYAISPLLLGLFSLTRRVRIRGPLFLVGTMSGAGISEEPTPSLSGQVTTEPTELQREDRVNPIPKLHITGVHSRIVANVDSDYFYIEFHYVGVNGTVFTLSFDSEVKGRPFCEGTELADIPEIIYPDVIRYQVPRGDQFVLTLRQKLTGAVMAGLMGRRLGDRTLGEKISFTFDKVQIHFRIQEGLVQAFLLPIPKTVQIVLPNGLGSESYRPEFHRAEF